MNYFHDYNNNGKHKEYFNSDYFSTLFSIIYQTFEFEQEANINGEYANIEQELLSATNNNDIDTIINNCHIKQLLNAMEEIIKSFDDDKYQPFNDKICSILNTKKQTLKNKLIYNYNSLYRKFGKLIVKSKKDYQNILKETLEFKSKTQKLMKYNK